MIRAIITSVVEGVIKRFSGSGRPDESFSSREYFQHYGFTSRPLAGAEAILIREGNQIIMIASDDRRYRLALEDGEVALYSDEGDHIHLKRGRKIEVSTRKLTVLAAEEVNVTAPQVIVTSSTQVKVITPLALLGAGEGHKFVKLADGSNAINVKAT